MLISHATVRTLRDLAVVAYIKAYVNATADQFANYYDNIGPEDAMVRNPSLTPTDTLSNLHL